jgi:hypothetical protein
MLVGLLLNEKLPPLLMFSSMRLNIITFLVNNLNTAFGLQMVSAGYIKEPMFEIDKGLYRYYKIFQIVACYV